MSKRKKRHKKQLPPLKLLDRPGGLTDDQSYKVVEVLWKFLAEISVFTPAQKKELDDWIAVEWGIVVLRTENLEKMFPVVQDTITAYAMLDRLKG